MWLFRAFSQIVMHTAFSDMFGRRPMRSRSIWRQSASICCWSIWLSGNTGRNSRTGHGPSLTRFRMTVCEPGGVASWHQWVSSVLATWAVRWRPIWSEPDMR
ncbi:hypothetical protein V6L77_20465 [Pannonibacter sp. Pt2-lr]